MESMTSYMQQLTDRLKRLSRKIRHTDRYVLAGLVTAAVFALFAMIQLILILTVRASVTLDTAALILTDLGVAVICVVLALRRDEAVKKARRASRRKRPVRQRD